MGNRRVSISPTRVSHLLERAILTSSIDRSCDEFYNHFLGKLVNQDVCSFRRLTIAIHMVAAMSLSFGFVLSSSCEGSPFEKTAYDFNIVLFICLASASRHIFTRETPNRCNIDHNRNTDARSELIPLRDIDRPSKRLLLFCTAAGYRRIITPQPHQE